MKTTFISSKSAWWWHMDSNFIWLSTWGHNWTRVRQMWCWLCFGLWKMWYLCTHVPLQLYDILIYHTICKHIVLTTNNEHGKDFHSEEDFANMNIDNIHLNTMPCVNYSLSAQVHLCSSITALSAIEFHLVPACGVVKIMDTSETYSEAFSMKYK